MPNTRATMATTSMAKRATSSRTGAWVKSRFIFFSSDGVVQAFDRAAVARPCTDNALGAALFPGCRRFYISVTAWRSGRKGRGGLRQKHDGETPVAVSPHDSGRN